MTRSVRCLATALALSAVTACGSTVQVTGIATTADGVTNPLGTAPGSAPTASADTASAPATDATVDGASGAGAPGGTGGPNGGAVAPSRGPTSRPSGVSTGAAPRVVANGPGVTATTITIGAPYDPDFAQNQAALGNSAPVPDIKRYVEIVVADVNAKGGVAGRTLKVVFFPVRTSDSSTTAQKSEATCTFFTQDNPVLAVLGAFSQELVQCLQKRGVASSAGSIAGYDSATFRTLSTYFDVQALAADRIVDNLVTALQSQRYFTGWDTRAGAPGSAPVKVGILAPDTAQWKRTIPEVLVPALARIGVQVDPANIVIWRFPDNAAAQSESIAQIQSAVLRFQQNGVTHFIPAEHNSAGLFSTPANNQRYYPRYALSTATGAAVYAGSFIPVDMLRGALGVGWSPAIDLPAQQAQTKAYAGPGEAACIDTYRRAQLDPQGVNARGAALVVCDGVKLFKAAVEAVPQGQGLNAVTLLSGLETIGSSFAVAGLPVARFGPGRHYAASEGWLMRWDTSCECQVYSGKRYALR